MPLRQLQVGRGRRAPWPRSGGLHCGRPTWTTASRQQKKRLSSDWGESSCPAGTATAATIMGDALREGEKEDKAARAQRLLRRADGTGRLCAAEIMVNTPAVANLIRTEKVHQLRSVMQTGRAQGMCTLEGSVRTLLQQGLADPAEARAYLSERGE